MTMNLSLIDPFILAQDFPDALTGKISKSYLATRLAPRLISSNPGSGHSTALKFNRKGDLLASGRVFLTSSRYRPEC